MSRRPSSAPHGLSRRRWLLLLLAGGAIAFAAGAWLVLGRPAPLIQPLTGRIIPGTTTNASWLDRPERAAEERPDLALALIGIAPGMSVADVGAGTGYMTFRVAALVGPTGRVYANDIQPALLDIIRAKAAAQHTTNVVVVLGTEADARLPPGAIDVALLVDVYHELRQPQAILRSLRRALKPNGRLVLVEYRLEDPTVPIADTHRMSVAEARTEVQAEGFAFDQNIEQLPLQHIIIFRKPVG